jgi:hypothetical protein
MQSDPPNKFVPRLRDAVDPDYFALRIIRDVVSRHRGSDADKVIRFEVVEEILAALEQIREERDLREPE